MHNKNLPWLLTGIILILTIISTTIAVQTHQENITLKKMNIQQNQTLKKIEEETQKLTEKLMRAEEEAIREGAYNTSQIIQNITENIIKIQTTIGEEINVNIAIDYGNNTRIWHNNTRINGGETLFKATCNIAKVESTKYSYGTFIESIDEIKNDGINLRYWIWWRWDQEIKRWELGYIGSDRYIPINDETFIWTYTDTSKWPPKPP